MAANDLTAEDAVVECLAIVEQCAEATASSRYSDGYRAAAADIRAAIEARFGARSVAAWERDLREVEIEARTLSRVIGLLRREQTRTSSAAIRRAIADLIAAIDAEELESSVQLARDAG